MKIGPAGVPPSKFVISTLSGNIDIDTGHDTLMLPYPVIKLTKPHVTRYLSFWPGLLEAWLVLTSVKYHGNLYILKPLNQRLALTRLRATGPWHQYSTAKRAVLINISLISLACVAWRFCRAGRTSGEAAKAASCSNLLAVSLPSPAFY